MHNGADYLWKCDFCECRIVSYERKTKGNEKCQNHYMKCVLCELESTEFFWAKSEFRKSMVIITLELIW